MRGGDSIEIDIHSISKALTTVGFLEDIKFIGEDTICSAGTMDAFLLVVLMAELIESGSIEIKFNSEGSSEHNRVEYFQKLCESVKSIQK